MKEKKCGHHTCRLQDHCRWYIAELKEGEKYNSDDDDFKCQYFTKGLKKGIKHES